MILRIRYQISQKFNKETLKSLLVSAKLLPKLVGIELAANGLNDTFASEIEELFSVRNLKRIDLSRNDLGSQSALKISNGLRGEAMLNLEHLE